MSAETLTRTGYELGWEQSPQPVVYEQPSPTSTSTLEDVGGAILSFAIVGLAGANLPPDMSSLVFTNAINDADKNTAPAQDKELVRSA